MSRTLLTWNEEATLRAGLEAFQRHGQCRIGDEQRKQALQDLCLKYGGRIVLCDRYNIFVGVKL